MMMQKTKVKSLIVFVFLLTLFYGFTFILIDFIDTPVSSIKDIFLVSLRWGIYGSYDSCSALFSFCQ